MQLIADEIKLEKLQELQYSNVNNFKCVSINDSSSNISRNRKVDYKQGRGSNLKRTCYPCGSDKRLARKCTSRKSSDQQQAILPR